MNTHFLILLHYPGLTDKLYGPFHVRTCNLYKKQHFSGLETDELKKMVMAAIIKVGKYYRSFTIVYENQ